MAQPLTWSANWIWDHPGAEQKNYHLFLRKTFTLNTPAPDARIHISADSRYILFVNGQYVGRGPARCYPEWQYYDTYELGDVLRDGDNVIAVHGYYQGEHNSDYVLGLGGVIAQVQFGDDGPRPVVTDATWKVCHASQWSGSRMRKTWHDFVEVYDARRDVPGWRMVDFDDSGWDNAEVVEHDPDGWPRIPSIADLTPRDIPHMTREDLSPEAVLETGEIPAVKIVDDVLEQFLEDYPGPHERTRVEQADALLRDDTACARIIPGDPPIDPVAGARDVYLIVDFGKEVVGYPCVRLRAPKGTIVDFAYSERLINGRVPPHLHTIAYVDRYVCREGSQEFEQFTWKGLRYMEVVFRNLTGPVELERLWLVHSTYPVEDVGSFDSSDSLLNDIWRIGAHTTKLCMQDGYMDCPWREKSQWVGDARVELLANYAAFGDTQLARKFHAQVTQSQIPLGMTGQVAPFAGRNSRHPDPDITHEAFKGIPDFCLHWVCSVEEYFMYSGDRELVGAVYPNLLKALSWFEHFRTDNGLIADLPGWLFIDWADVVKGGTSTVYNGLYAMALGKTISLARVLGHDGDVPSLQGPLDEIRAAMRARLWDDARGVFVDAVNDGAQVDHVSMHANAMAILCGAAPESRTDGIVEYILDERNPVILTQPFFSHFLLLALQKLGKTGTALDFIRTHWGRMVDAGSSTTWERWSAVTEPRGGSTLSGLVDSFDSEQVSHYSSMAHAWSASPTWFLSRFVLGVRPTTPGFATCTIEPRTDLLHEARGTVPTPRGPVSVEWSDTSGELRMKVSTPEGVDGEVVRRDQ